VICHRGSHKWIKAGTQQDAKILKREIESRENSKRVEKLGLSGRQKRIDDFCQEYADHVRLRTSPNTVKRYRAALNAFLAFLRLFHPNLKSLHQIKPEIIESYQQKQLESVELKIAADGDKVGVHKNKRLPKPQTVNYEVGVLRSAFMWAHDRELIPFVPTKKVKRLRPAPAHNLAALFNANLNISLSHNNTLIRCCTSFVKLRTRKDQNETFSTGPFAGACLSAAS
jgi:hypothetical protein